MPGVDLARLESRALSMLSKAVPASVYELALSSRNTTTVGIIYVTLKTEDRGAYMSCRSS